MGFPTAFTLMGLGMVFGFTAFYDPSQPWMDNRVFNLMVQRTFGAMTNDTLLSIPLFVLMGYIMERGALVEESFLLIEGVRQLRGERDAGQVKNAHTALVHGNGGVLSAQATVILGDASTV